MGVSKFFKELRSRENLTQKALSEKLGISVTAVKDLESSKTKFPNNQKIFDNLSEHFGYKNQLQLCCDMLFNDESDPGYNLEPIYQRYLAKRKLRLYHTEIEYSYKTIKGSTDKFIGLVWVPHLNYYKMIIAPYNRKAFIKAIDNSSTSTSTKNLINTIVQETEFFDNIKDKTNYKCIRFLLDKNNVEDVKVFKAISKIKKPNIGRYASISFQLVDIDKCEISDKDIYIVTDHKINKMLY